MVILLISCIYMVYLDVIVQDEFLKKEEIKKYKDKKEEFFSEKINICDQNFEAALNEIRINMHKKVEEKISEYNILKADFLNAKIERDKFCSEFTLLNDDYKSAREIFQKQLIQILLY